MHGRSAATEGAELASGLEAIVLGAGLAHGLPEGLRGYALPLLVGGVFAHGFRMTRKYFTTDRPMNDAADLSQGRIRTKLSAAMVSTNIGSPRSRPRTLT